MNVVVLSARYVSGSFVRNGGIDETICSVVFVLVVWDGLPGLHEESSPISTQRTSIVGRFCSITLAPLKVRDPFRRLHTAWTDRVLQIAFAFREEVLS